MEVEDFDQWNEKVENVKKHNAILLDGYRFWLEMATLSEIEKAQYHAGITFFANTFLTMDSVLPVEQGFEEIDSYLGDFFIREVPWATPETIESTGTGFVKTLFTLYFSTCSVSIVLPQPVITKIGS